MNKIAAMLNLGPKNSNLVPGMQNAGPKNSNLVPGMQNALFGRGPKDGNNVGPSSEQNLPQPPGLQPAPVNAMNHQMSPSQLPPGFTPNLPGRELLILPMNRQEPPTQAVFL